jgi:hypothetical protein
MTVRDSNYATLEESSPIIFEQLIERDAGKRK